MTRAPEGEPQPTTDAEVELFKKYLETFDQNFAKINNGFEAFCERNGLEILGPRNEPTTRALTADLGGDIHPTIRLTVSPDMDDEGSFRSRGVNVIIEVAADGADNHKDRFMRPKVISQFQVDEGSLIHLNRKTVPRLTGALRTARSITEADLTDSRLLRHATL